ncbi:MAG: hypothetical protein IH840_11050 [Candidatus Heimdallarchaeota archaeon]|nr:hypothetical protein [Candidatus Heimdallarchaeota archaeon]
MQKTARLLIAVLGANIGLAIVAYAVILTWLAPVLLAPLFNRFEPLEPGAARDAVLELGARAEVEIGWQAAVGGNFAENCTPEKILARAEVQ